MNSGSVAPGPRCGLGLILPWAGADQGMWLYAMFAEPRFLLFRVWMPLLKHWLLILPNSGGAKIQIRMGIYAAWFGSPLSPRHCSMLSLFCFPLLHLLFLWVMQFCQLTAQILLSWWSLRIVINVLGFVVPWVSMGMSSRLHIYWSILACGIKKSRQWWHCGQQAFCETLLSEISLGQPGCTGTSYLVFQHISKSY